MSQTENPFESPGQKTPAAERSNHFPIGWIEVLLAMITTGSAGFVFLIWIPLLRDRYDQWGIELSRLTRWSLGNVWQPYALAGAIILSIALGLAISSSFRHRGNHSLAALTIFLISLTAMSVTALFLFGALQTGVLHQNMGMPLDLSPF